MLAKSWRRIKNNILLYKSGTEGFANSGLEPYSEYYADYSLVIAPVVADLCTTPVALSAPPNSYQNNSQS